MIYLLGLISFLLVLTAEAKVGSSAEFPFCRDTKECLLFDLVCKTDDYEVRYYESMRVVSTNESGIFMEMATLRAYRRLIQYFRGANKDGEKIDMIAPILVRVLENRSYWQPGSFTMSFTLPAKYQETPPEPTDKKVFFQKTRDLKAYVKSYRGWMTTRSDQHRAKQLLSDLDSVGADYIKGVHYAVPYDRPMTLFNRYNEVWYVAEGNPVCATEERP